MLRAVKVLNVRFLGPNEPNNAIATKYSGSE